MDESRGAFSGERLITGRDMQRDTPPAVVDNGDLALQVRPEDLRDDVAQVPEMEKAGLFGSAGHCAQ